MIFVWQMDSILSEQTTTSLTLIVFLFLQKLDSDLHFFWSLSSFDNYIIII